LKTTYAIKNENFLAFFNNLIFLKGMGWEKVMGKGHDSPIPTPYTPFPNSFLHTITAIRKAGAA
jgi:hypothetical protein